MIFIQYYVSVYMFMYQRMYKFCCMYLLAYNIIHYRNLIGKRSFFFWFHVKSDKKKVQWKQISERIKEYSEKAKIVTSLATIPKIVMLVLAMCTKQYTSMKTIVYCQLQFTIIQNLL